LLALCQNCAKKVALNLHIVVSFISTLLFLSLCQNSAKVKHEEIHVFPSSFHGIEGREVFQTANPMQVAFINGALLQLIV